MRPGVLKIVVDKAIPFLVGRISKDVEVVFLPGNDISAADVKDADALIVRTRTRCDASLLEGSSVKLVTTATIGTDHIDMGWCRRNNIAVRNAPGCNAPGVAQYVFASLFNTGFNPDKDILGIVGYGNVGSVVARWAQNMGIKILISDLPRQEAGEKDVDYHSLEKVLRESDALTLHVPLTYREGRLQSEYPTFHMLGERELDLMKPGAMLVNSSRGGVVDEKALKRNLRDGKLRAIIDVWENEPEIDPELLKLSMISTPHIAGYSAQGKKRATFMVLEAVGDFFNISIDLSGLEDIPTKNMPMTSKMILESYNPEYDSIALKRGINEFEKLRNNYKYRNEPLFS